MQNFTPLSSLIGGIIIGLAASILLLFNGKIAGISGIFAGVMHPAGTDTGWRVSFIMGMLSGGLMLRLWYPRAFDFGGLRSIGTLAIAGLLVGFGTRLGNGCTSGHGVCGVSRLSIQSAVATITFIASGAAIVFVINHMLGGSV